VPHKQAVIPYLDEITPDAQAIGAVNTILVQNSHLIGHNTDGDGFLASLREEGFEPAGRQALLLGAGGAARAVLHALIKSRCSVTIHNRTTQRTETLAHDMQVSVAADLSSLDLDCFDLLVNTTPAGMWPRIDTSPWPESLPLPSHWTVYDLVYNPAETQLLIQAAAIGARPIGGLGMLVHQGALAFELWTGRPAPVEVMRTAAEDALLHS
jgi:shikimate dehydrogenase